MPENVDVSNDPFMTHTAQTQAAQRPGHGATRSGDAFMTQSQGRAGRTFAKDNRTFRDLAMMVLGPLLCFIMVQAVFLFAHHNLYTSKWAVLCFFAVFSGALIVGGMMSRQAAFLVLGSLMLSCTIGGLVIGTFGWDSYQRQVDWMSVGREYTNISGRSPGAAKSDAAVLRFSGGGNHQGAVVDGTRSIGFVDNDLYCVAPILDISQVNVQVPRVEYWAVGLNCCNRRGGFSCDDANTLNARSAVVAPKSAPPCPGCSREIFEKAIEQAESVHSVVSTPGHLLVRFVNDPVELKDSLRHKSWLLISISSVCVLLLSLFITCLAQVRGLANFSSTQSRMYQTTMPASMASYSSTRRGAP